MMSRLVPMLVVLTVFAAFPLMAAEGDARREAARLAAQRAEEATRRANTSDSGPVQPASKPPAVDEQHVEIVSDKDVTLHGAGDLVGNRYRLLEIDGEKVAGDAGAFVEWTSGTAMNGKLCNLFRAGCSFENTVVKGEQLPARTKMACADEAMGKAEARFFAALRLGMSFVAVGESLEMRRDDLVLRFALEKEEVEKAEEKETDKEEAIPEEEEDSAPEKADAAEEPAGEPVEEETPSSGPIVSEAVVVEETLIDRKFVLSKVDGEEFATSGKQPFIEFGEGMRVGGSACNTFTGLGTLADGRLVVANAVATRMMCFDAKVNEFEKYFHRMLREGAAVAADDETLTLTGGGRVLEFVEEE